MSRPSFFACLISPTAPALLRCVKWTLPPVSLASAIPLATSISSEAAGIPLSPLSALTLPVAKAPKKVVNAALKAAAAIGDGLYGVDLKQVGDKVYVIEVNDNPNIDAGFEDEVLQDELYLRVVEVFLKRIERRKTGSLNV